MLTESRIRDQIASLLADEMTLSDFVEWLDEVTWDMDESLQAAAKDLLQEADLWVGEFSFGHRSLDSLRRSLGDSLSTFRLSVGPVVSVMPRRVVSVGSGADSVGSVFGLVHGEGDLGQALPFPTNVDSVSAEFGHGEGDVDYHVHPVLATVKDDVGFAELTFTT